MKKLTLILLFLWIVASSLFAQIATNKIQNMATIMLTNSTLYIGGTNFVVNGTRYNSSDVMKIWARDGAIEFGTVTPIHNRILLSWYTNSSLTANAWNVGQDVTGIQVHTWGIQDAFNNKFPFLIASNQSINIDIPVMVLSSNLFVSNSVTILGTNNARFYMVNGVRGMTLSVTNVGIGMTNVEVFAEGLLTNKFTIP